MKKSLLGSLFTAAVLCTSSLSHASLDGFDDYDLGGTTASWDIFYGIKYQPNYSFETGTAGNAVVNGLGENFILGVSVNSFIPGVTPWQHNPANGVATGPIEPISGNPNSGEKFYTYNATSVTFTIYGMVGEGETLDVFVFQVFQDAAGAGGLSNVKFNNSSTLNTSVNGNGVQYWIWSGLGLQENTSFQLTFELNTQHSNIEALQIQMDAQAVPEPSTWMLIGLGSALVLWNTRRRAGMTVA